MINGKTIIFRHLSRLSWNLVLSPQEVEEVFWVILECERLRRPRDNCSADLVRYSTSQCQTKLSSDEPDRSVCGVKLWARIASVRVASTQEQLYLGRVTECRIFLGPESSAHHELAYGGKVQACIDVEGLFHNITMYGDG